MGNGVTGALGCPWHTCTWQPGHIPGGLLPCLAMCFLKEGLLRTEILAIKSVGGSLKLSRAVDTTVMTPAALHAHEHGGG